MGKRTRGREQRREPVLKRGRTGNRQPRRPAARAKTGRRRARRSGRSLLWPATRTMLALAVWGFIAAAAALAWFAYDLPDISDVADGAARPPGMTVRAADGAVLARFGAIYGRPVRLADLPAHVGRAVLAIEDRRFYSHPGIDVVGVGRAAVANLRAGTVRQGGSTLTQQLAKNLFLTREKTARRKIQEALLALWLERRLSKDQILTVYLNRVYFGAGAYGVDAAAERYFGRPAETLTLYQSAVLAGLLRAPSRDNPLADPARAADRANRVLDAMVESGWLDPAVAARERRERVPVHRTEVAGDGARYFVDWVREQVDSILGFAPGDVEVLTTLDPRLQRLAEDAVASALAGEEAVDREGALVAMTPDGAVRAMVGGRSYPRSQFNRATQALRQPGSAFKLFVYLAGLEAGFTPQTVMDDRPVTVAGWSPRNAGSRWHGPVTLREALAQSHNSVAVQVAEAAGRNRVIAWARRLGITSPLSPTPSLALGTDEVTPVELTAAYAALAANGRVAWPYAVREIRDRTGTVLYRRESAPPRRVVPPEHVAAITDMLSAVLVSGTGTAARLDRPAAGKTGTTQDSRDAWFVGFTAELVAGVWIGNDSAAPMRGVAGGTAPARAWRAFMAGALADRPPRPLPGLLPASGQRLPPAAAAAVEVRPRALESAVE